jgi:poly-beta-1,6-N-acetyl-D-glucosamine synthase
MSMIEDSTQAVKHFPSMVGRASSYVLVTAAHNEEAYISGVIESVLAQTKRPAKWVIISDSSTDRTDEIVRSYSEIWDFIEFLHITQENARGTPSKVNALRSGLPKLNGIQYDFIGNLDADVCLPSDYYEGLLKRFERDCKLGIGGGAIFEQKSGRFMPRATNRRTSVAHAAQLIRRECFEAIDGYLPLKYGGEDWCAEVSSRMKGWSTETFAELKVLHLRAAGSSYQWHKRYFQEGRADCSFGSDPIFEILKCLGRVKEKPIVVGTLTRLAGYWWSVVTREGLAVPGDVALHLRQEQRSRMRRLLSFLRL